MYNIFLSFYSFHRIYPNSIRIFAPEINYFLKNLPSGDTVREEVQQGLELGAVNVPNTQIHV